jgi:glycosyltransferase involved in cell wall biosynthesis
LITTERNEKDTIAEFIESALSQSLQPDQIIIADGGSSDGTVEIIQDYIKKGAPITLVNAPGNRSVGRNAATAASRNEVIACTDVGNRLDADWLKHITQPFRDKPDAMVVSGNFKAEPETYFEKVSATLMLQSNDNIDLDTWLPSSRSIAYTKTAWETAGRYPEHTNFNEDTPFDLALRAAGYKFEDGLKAIVYWRPRPTLKEFYKQYYFYAVGDGLDAINYQSNLRLLLKYLVIIAATVGQIIVYPPTLIIFWGYILYRYWTRIRGAWKHFGDAKTLGLMFVITITFELSQIRGYWHGYFNKNKLRGSQKLVR